MRYLSFVTFLLFFAFIGNAKAESYVVDAAVLNVRSCAGTDCKIIGKLTQGDLVNSIQDHGEWVEIERDGGSGYVIRRALANDNSVFSAIGVLFLIILGVWLLIFIYMLPSRVAADNKNANKIYWVNLWLGWVPVIWCLLLLAALIGDSREE